MPPSSDANSLNTAADTLTARLEIQSPSPLQLFQPDWPGASELQIWVKRDDLLHPIISGNKWRKLKYALAQLQVENIDKVISFGGGFSNHLHALGYCCQRLGIALEARIRGDYSKHPSPMIDDLIRWGTTIKYLNKRSYKEQTELAAANALTTDETHTRVIPEGGSQQQALPGVAEILSELPRDFDHILLPVGSGGTLAGLVSASPGAKLHGIAVLKGQDYLEQLVKNLLDGANQNHWQILHDYHGGGYGKADKNLQAFCHEVEENSAIPLEPVYSGKLFCAARQLMEKGYFNAGSKILLLHTGGLQGARASG
ncbi:pyridoxal-phosphate dependent enzyme [Aliiglaciecola sp. CAU 1673]|uniref:1-aminocyclopropane-1-carboxylate deaminase/D-cysteine desulfhydrase n=1 Tax=Aliiglaciecola sp. CAU 1673 TaxID=3032595 RepID=UPI0023DCDABE|nr:pyridoxal-phosphate dependent enzyme [Aliiglaciecola sp. CAU 1673]MDF2179520.1 pyridoxal-phosphate dependent enzyme [Aliiglaciecola sp. CAU 1673]